MADHPRSDIRRHKHTLPRLTTGSPYSGKTHCMPGIYRDLPGHLARKQQEETEEEELEVRAGGSRDVPVDIKMCVSK